MAPFDQWGMIHFRMDVQELIYYARLRSSFDKLLFDSDLRLEQEILETVAHTYRRRSITKDMMFEDVNTFITFCQSGWIVEGLSDEIQWSKLRTAIIEVIVDCADNLDQNDINSIRRNDSLPDESRLNPQVLPYFVYEPHDIGPLLDYILVNWPYPLPSMTKTQRRLALLKRYSEEALDIFEKAYSDYESNSFPIRLNDTWQGRSRLYFDCENLRLPYIDHIYTENFTVPYTHGKTDIFIARITEGYGLRNPHVSRSCIDEILNVYPIVNSSPGYRDLQLYYSNYEEGWMCSADHYFEKHRIQFYRTLFFFLELEERGLSIEDVIPWDIQMILGDDKAYSDYLVERRRRELENDGMDNEYRQNLADHARVREEDLIMLSRMRLRDRKLREDLGKLSLGASN